MDRQFLRVLLSALLVIFAVGLTLSVTQDVPFSPLDPAEWHSASTVISNVWTDQVGGSQFSSVQGNYTPPSTNDNSIILLNTVDTPRPASVTYQIPLALAKDASGGRTEISIYIPGTLFFANDSEPLVISVNGLLFRYEPTVPENFSWHPSGPVWIPNSTDLVSAPGYAGSGDSWLRFATNTTQSNQPLVISVTVSSFDQIYISSILVIATGPPFAFQPSLSQERGILLLPLLAGGLTALAYLARRLFVPSLLHWLTAGILLRIAIMPLFLHADILNELRYPLQLYDGGTLGIGTFGYGPVWLAELVAPPASLFALGINPTINSLNVLVKLPNIAFDALTYLLLYRLLVRRLSAFRARLWANVSWWLNPMVIYFGAAHGLYESTVGFLILAGVVAYSEKRPLLGSTAGGVAVSSILATAIVFPVILVQRVITWRYRALLIAIPAILYLGVSFFASGSANVVSVYLSGMIGRGTGYSVNLGVALHSQQSPLTVIYDHLGISISAELGLIAVLAVSAYLALRGRNLAPIQFGWVVYASLLAFYVTYPTFYVQHLLWSLPLSIALLGAATGGNLRSLALILSTSFVGMAVNWMSYWLSTEDPYVSFTLFLLLTLPLLLCTGTGRWLLIYARKHLLHAQCLVVASLGVVIAWQGLSWGWGEEILLAAFSVALAVRLLETRLQTSLVEIVAPASRLTAIIAPWVMLYKLSYNAPTVVQLVFIGFCLYALTELGLLLAVYLL
jgi:hypothetical protein